MALFVLSACLSLDGKDRCFEDADCLDGRVCGVEGRCVDELAVDAGSLKAYGETCGEDEECASRLCNLQPLICEPSCFCSRECSIAGDLTNCGKAGRYCTNNVYVGIESVCVFVVSSGPDEGADDNKLILATLAAGRIDAADDADVFAADLEGQMDYELHVIPSGGAMIDIAVDIHTHLGLSYRRNGTGPGLAEAFGIPGILKDGRLFFVVRTLNDATGTYSIQLDYL
jgi:hypothetical protein